MTDIITIYLLLNCLVLAYVRLRDTQKLDKVLFITRPIFIIYIGLLATPLIFFQWIISKFKNKNIKKIEIKDID